MARIDKSSPVAGTTRAALAADFTTPANYGKVLGVGLDATGRLVVGAGNSGIKGVMVLTEAYYAGDVVDFMRNGEIVEFPGVAGSNYFSDAAGVVSTTNTGVYLGHTVEATRLVVSCKPSGGAA
jgi:hypothetical protein